MAKRQVAFINPENTVNCLIVTQPYIKKLQKARIEAQGDERHIEFAQVRTFFKQYALQYKNVLYVLLFLTVSQAAVLGFGLWYIKFAIDVYFQEQKVMPLILALLLITIVKSLLEFLYKWGRNYYQMSIRDKLIEDAFSHLLHNDFYLHLKVRNSRKYGWVLEDTEKFIESMFVLYQIWIRQPMQIASVFIAALLINWQLALLGLVVVPALLPVFLFIRKKSSQYIKERRALLGLLEEKVAETVYAIRIVKTFGLEKIQTNQLRKILNRQRETFSKNAFYNGLMSPLVEAIGLTGLIIILLIGMQSVQSSEFTAGTFLAFLMAFLNVYRPLKEITMAVHQHQLALDTGRRLISLEQNAEVPINEKSMRAVADIDTLEFKNVGFSYDLLQPENTIDKPKWVLQGVNLQLNKGETILLAGMSGAGKSTLCDLLFGLFKIYNGQILINGQEIKTIAKSDLRKLISMCSQETIVFDDTLLQNIQIVAPEASEHEIRQVAKMVCLPEHLLAQMDKPIGDRGISLSGGERQRLALARAIISRPQLLVIDEAMNNIDPDTEAKIWGNMKTYLPNCTFIVISHRWLDLSQYDRLIILGRGRILENIDINKNISTKELFEKYQQVLELVK